MILNKVVPSCTHCRYSDLIAGTFPCSACSDEYEHFTPKPECTSCIHGSRSSGEPACSVCNDTKGEATSVCNDCEYNGTPRLTYPCTRCMANPINIALQKSAEAGYQKFVDEMNSRPTPLYLRKGPGICRNSYLSRRGPPLCGLQWRLPCTPFSVGPRRQ